MPNGKLPKRRRDVESTKESFATLYSEKNLPKSNQLQKPSAEESFTQLCSEKNLSKSNQLREPSAEESFAGLCSEKNLSMRRERFDKMNVVPFIDIVLVLLVIILATATFVTNQTIKVDLPSASSKQKEQKKSITLAINKKGEYFYNTKAFSLTQIKEKLLKLDPKKDIISLKMDKHSEFRHFVDIIDILKTKGFENISIVTKQ